jgi:hypothetical protein
MHIMDEEARKWLTEHAQELGPEEILFEEEKMENALSCWPIPRAVSNLGIYAHIDTSNNFNRIVGDHNNWDEILSRNDLYNYWILPHAVLLFGKTWFDRVKWRSYIRRGTPFSLFSDSDKSICKQAGLDLEDTSAGKARIKQISDKIESTLQVYMKSTWHESGISKPPGGYIVEALKNNFVKEIGADLGYKLRPTPACPQCLSSNNVYKTVLTRNLSNQYSCPRCIDLAANLELRIQSLKDKKRFSELKEVNKQHIGVTAFKLFSGTTCVCPSNACVGKFVPITCINKGVASSKPKELRIMLNAISKVKEIKGINVFKEAEGVLRKLPLVCPFCDTKFTPAVAQRFESGFKGKSGYFTGLPSIYIWKKPEETILDQSVENTLSLKDKLAATVSFADDSIFVKQRVNILIDEMLIKAQSLKRNSFSSTMTWYFYMASIRWMSKYWADAFRYFFGGSTDHRDMTAKEMLRYPGCTKKKVTNILRGQEVAVHHSFLRIWMDVLESNIDALSRLDSSISGLKDLKWFCRSPKFSGGPESTFRSQVDFKRRVPNKSRIQPTDSKRPAPRLARIIHIYKVEDNVVCRDRDYVDDVRACEWHAIQLNPKSDLNQGDKVCVTTLMMPGHPTHAPIQRILRLRSKVLSPIVSQVLEEEKLGTRDTDFWNRRKETVNRAMNDEQIASFLRE